jgi:hypothetical protein
MSEKPAQFFPHPLVWLVAFLLLAGYACTCLKIAHDTSPTFDEPDHIAVGYYTLTHHGERPYTNINLTFTQLWSALPLLAFKTPPHFPTPEELQAGQAAGINYGRQFYFDPRNDTEAIVFWSRAMITLLAVVLGAVLFLWARRLWGDVAGLVTLAFFCLNPQTIALGSFATTDIASTLFFTLAVAAVWRLLQRITLLNIVLTGLVAGVLGATKISSLLIIPVAGLLLILRVAAKRPLEIKLPWQRAATTTTARLLPLGGALVGAVLVAYATLWAFYSFSFPATHEVVPEAAWAGNNLVKAHVAPVLINFCRAHHLLPEAYLYDLHLFTTTGSIRRAFVLGEYSVDGWWYFFPVAWLFKTPLPFMLSLAAGAVLLWRARREQLAALWSLAPLLVFGAVYGAATLTSNLNIGARHLLPLHPLLFLVAGFVTRLPLAGWRRPAWVVGLLAWSALEVAMVHPHHLAYFNELAGGSAHGHRILVDSSYEWGEELPDVRRWLEARDAKATKEHPAEPVYFSYFGCADLEHYGIRSISKPGDTGNAVILPSFYDQRQVQLYDLGAGTYVISATMLKSLYGARVMGPWRQSYEDNYQALCKEMLRLKEAMSPVPSPDPALVAEGRNLLAQRLLAQQDKDVLATEAGRKRAGDEITAKVAALSADDKQLQIFIGQAKLNRFIEAEGRDLAIPLLMQQQYKDMLTTDVGRQLALVKAKDDISRVSRDQLIQLGNTNWSQKIRIHDELRFSRLCAYLRTREPEGRIGYGLLVFELTDKEIEQAVSPAHPPAELRRDYFVKGTEHRADNEIDFIR